MPYALRERIERLALFPLHRAREQLGDNYDLLIEKSNDLMLGKSNRHEKSAIASHYRQQYDEMLRKRAGGVIGYLEFMGW